MNAAINEMLNDFDFMDKLNKKERNEILIASIEKNPRVSLTIINKWEKHNGLSYDKTGNDDIVRKMYGIY